MRLFTFFLTILSINLYADTGTLILAHGSMKGCGYDNPTLWEQGIHKIVNRIRPKVKQEIQVAFGMWNTMCFEQGIQKLQERLASNGKTLTHLKVLPLFLSSHSLVIEIQKYIFKKINRRVLPIPMAKPVKFSGEISYMNALDYQPQLSMIMANRAHHLIHMSKDQGFSKKQMEIIFTMHGPVDDNHNIKWMEMAQKYIRDISYIFPVKKYHIISLRDDAADPVRDAATKELQTLVQDAKVNNGIALVLPFLLSKGGIEQGILDRLKGLDFIWAGEAILPDAFFDQVLIEKLK
jgi:hypothetical protein